MKTGKKLLSFFLAVVMMVTTCSVGFTAFAAEQDKGIWKDSTSADSAFDALEELVDTYVPQLLNIDAVKKLLEDELGMTVTSTTSISDVILGVSPMLLGILGSEVQKEQLLPNYQAGLSDIKYAYLDDADAKMTFYEMASFISTNMDQEGYENPDRDLAEWANNAYPRIGALLQQYSEKEAEQQQNLALADTALSAAYQTITDAAAAENTALPDSLQALKAFTFTYDGKVCTVDDLIAYDDFKDAAKCYDAYNSYFELADSDTRIKTLSDALWYLKFEDYSNGKGTINEALQKKLCSLAGVSYADVKDDAEALNEGCKLGLAIYISGSDDFLKEYNQNKLGGEMLDQLVADLNQTVPGRNVKVGSSRSYMRAYMNNEYADIPCALNQKLIDYFNGLDNNSELLYRRAIQDGKYTLRGQTMTREEAVQAVNNGLLDTYFDGELAASADEAVRSFKEYADAKTICATCTPYRYEDFEIPDKFTVSAVNNLINNYMVLLDPNDEEGVTIAGLTLTGKVVMEEVVNRLVETPVDLKSALTDVWLRLYEKPVETIMELLPTIVVLLDEVIIPMVFNQDGDPFYNFLYGLLSGLMESVSQEGGSPTGIGGLSFDLNIILPDLMHWLLADKNYTFTYYNVTDNQDGTYTYGETTTGSYDAKKTPVILNIYVADQALQYAKISDIKGAGGEAVTELATFFTAAVDQYVAQHAADAKSGALTQSEGMVYNHGLNNIFVALPQILDIMGKNFLTKYSIASDWSYCDYKISTQELSGVTFWYNDSLITFKNLANGGKAAEILDSFVNIFVNDWLNAIIDLLNDATATDNKLTKNIPIISGLLRAIGGLGNKSVLSDVLNGVFQLNYNDEASFVLDVYNKKSGFVGFSDKSAYFLISNVGQLINVITSIDTKKANKIDVNFPKTGTPNSIPANVEWAKVPKTASKSGDSFLSKLDAMLSGVLENSTINNFNMNTTTGLLSGVLSLASYYMGSDNADPMMKILNKTLNLLNDKDRKSTNTSDKKIYTQANLTNLVVQTYVLIENLLDYYIVNEDAVKINVFYDSKQNVYSSNASGRYSYNILAAALKGLISPHAVSNHVTNAAAAKKLASLDSWHSAVKANKSTNGWTGDTNITINWGFSAGDNKKFFASLGESLGIITDLVGVLMDDAGYYDTVFYPIFKDIEKAQGINLGIYAKGTVTDGVTGLLSIITPISKLLDAFYAKPVTVLLNLVKGISITLNKNLNAIAHNVFEPLYNEVKGISTILSAKVSNLCPSLAKNDAWFTSLLQMIVCKDSSKPTKSETETINTVLNLLKGNFKITDADLIELINGLTSSLGITIPKNLFKNLAACKNAEAVLDYLLRLVVKLVTNDTVIDLLKALINNESASQLLDMIGRLSYSDLMNIIEAVLAKTTDPTEVYWTFLQYVQEKTTGFYYPAGVTAADAEDAVDQLDNVVASVFALLNGLDVVDQDNLGELLNGLLFTNENLTALAKGLYGAIEPYAEYLAIAGIDVSKKGVASMLTDKEYGNTYSSAAKAIKNAKSWKKLEKVNWGFTNGSAKAQQGFVNALAAILRPFNDVLAVLLAGDDLAIGDIVKDLIRDLSVGKSSDTVQLKNGQLIIKVKGTDKYSKTSTIKLDLNAVVEEIEDLKIYGGNGYESAIVPLLEALECSGVKTYKQYKADIRKAKDNVLLDVLNPIFAFLNDVLEAPFDTLTAILPNVAYFIDNNGLAQLVNNLLSPITSLLPVLKDNGLNINTIIKMFTNGKSLNAYVTDALGVNIHLDLNDLNKCDIQNAIIPLVNSLIKKYKLSLPDIDWGELASHGTVSTVKSAAKNSQGNYTRKHVTARQGETLIAVLRYISNLLIDNIQGLKSLLGGIKDLKDAMGIINVVLNQIGTASADQIIRALFYFLQEEPTNAFWNYSNYQTKEYDFEYPSTVDVKFLKNISPMLDGLISELLPLNKTVSDALFKDELISKMVQGIGKAMDGVKINDSTTLTDLLAQTGIDYSTQNVAKLLNDSSYGKTYAANASIIGSASSWANVNVSSLKWGVTDRDSFFNALCAALRPFYGVLDVLLNDASLGIFDIVYLPGSNGYTSCIVPLLEAFSAYNIKTQYQYREDISKAYDNLLLDIINPIWDKVEDILNAPLQVLMAMLPNLALFIANDGLLQLIENLLVPISALLDAIKPLADLNVVLDKVFELMGVDLNQELSKLGLNLDLNINLYDLTAMLKPLIGADNIVPLLNQVLGLIKIKDEPLGLELMDIDWYQLASHGEYVKAASQAATFGVRVYVEGDASETLIALLRYLIDVVNYKDNYQTITDLVGSLIGGSDDETVTDIVTQVLGMLKGETDNVISQLCELLQTLGS